MNSGNVLFDYRLKKMNILQKADRDYKDVLNQVQNYLHRFIKHERKLFSGNIEIDHVSYDSNSDNILFTWTHNKSFIKHDRIKSKKLFDFMKDHIKEPDIIEDVAEETVNKRTVKPMAERYLKSAESRTSNRLKREINMREYFDELYNKDRLRYDDALIKVAEKFGMTTRHTERILRRTSLPDKEE